MSYTDNDIYIRIKEDEGLTHLLPLIDDVAILEYDGRDISGSIAVSNYLKDNDINNEIIKRVVVFGKKDQNLESNIERLSTLFPSAEITPTYKSWKRINVEKVRVQDILVLHMSRATDVRENIHSEHMDKLKHIIASTRKAYYACFISKDFTYNLFDNECVIKSNLSISDIRFKTALPTNERTSYCRDKEEYIKSCLNNLSKHNTFFQCLEEVEHGCEECNQCGNYGSKKYCPMAQRYIAKCYREGVFVPKNEKIAHQWEIMASHQNYKPATIQVADDMKDGIGCEQDIDKAITLYSRYASNVGNEDLANKIISLAESQKIQYPIAIPYMAMLANSGDEDMVIKLSDSFAEGTYGLPKDMVQQKEWIEQGAENGNPRFVEAMAKMYEDNSDWRNAYHWYQTLSNYDDNLVPDGKLEEIELKMLTNGKTNKDIAISGRNYLYGWYGVDRNTHLAYRCLKYASDAGIPMAEGLLGQMYYKGLEVEKDEDKGHGLLVVAAREDDIMSMDELTKIDCVGSPEKSEWADVIPDKIEDGISNGDAVAYYLKGHYYAIGFCYEENPDKAFEYMSYAAELEYPIAQYQLALMYKEGIGTESSEPDFIKWLKKSADNGYYEAQGCLGVLRFNKSIYNDIGKTFKLLENAYEQGYEPSSWPLAQCYMYGYGTAVDQEKAYPMYIKAAESGEVGAQEKLCEDYFSGNNNIKKDYKECAKWGEKALSNGNKKAKFETAYALAETGNKERAKELYLDLAKEGNAAAMNNYACQLSDSKESIEWFKKSAEKGNYTAYWNLGRYYRDGTGVEQNSEKAIEYLSKAAKNGNTGPMMDIASIYQYGTGIEKDGSKALEWLKKAADNGEYKALFRIGTIYREGQLIPQNMEESITFYQKAAEKDNVLALVELGKIFEYGIGGIVKNNQKAIYWYRKAATKRNKEAQENLKRLHSNWLDENGNVVDGNTDKIDFNKSGDDDIDNGDED